MLTLQRFLQTELADNAAIVSSIYLGAKPATTVEEPSYPMIVIQPAEGESGNESATAQIKLIFTCQANSDSDLIDVLGLMERVRALLLRTRTLDHKFRMEPNWKWKHVEDHPEPQWVFHALTTWTLPQIRQEVRTI